MFCFQKPTFADLTEYLNYCSDKPFSYEQVGQTCGPCPKGYSCGHRRTKLGQGRQMFLRARRSLQEWKMFPVDFVDLIWPVPLEEGRVVATLFCAPGFWTLNPCRIVYTFDDVVADADLACERFGFAYGTVGDHFASGEERFTVEYDHSDESVWYEVFCFSKARHWLTKAAYPYLRMQQYRFRCLSGRAMQVAVRDPVTESRTVAI